MQTEQQYSLDRLQERKVESIDRFRGQRVKIVSGDIKPIKGGYVTDSQTQKSAWDPNTTSYKLFLTTESVGISNSGKPIVGSESYWLKVIDGVPTFPEKGELKDLMAKLGVKNPADLIGKEVILDIRVGEMKEGERFPPKFLGFM